MWKKIDLTIFPSEREKNLKNIYRFSLFETILYRSNLWMHSYRVLWILEQLLPIISRYISIDEEKARILALVHDDAEMITGDIQAGRKARMNKQDLKTIEEEEAQAVEIITKVYPNKVHGYSYKELLLSALNKDTPEAHIVSFSDKMDAYCESMHEVVAGNISLLGSLTDSMSKCLRHIDTYIRFQCLSCRTSFDFA